MKFELGFYGAAGNVTGSRYCLNANGKQILIDCGLYQEHQLKDRNWEHFNVNPSKLDAVILTHAHLDHCGLLPRLVKDGFSGPIYCTSATADIVKIVLLDCAHINEEDAEYKRQRHEREGRQGRFPVKPLYTTEEAKNVLPLLTPWDMKRPISLGDGLQVEFIEVAHILGASSLRFTITQNDETRKLVFSGDIGRWDMPILRDPSPIGEADYVVMESTYGNRLHGPQSDIEKELADVINDTANRGGNIIIPSFAIERTQELLFFLTKLLHANKIPHLRIFIDSPMAVRVTEVFKRHPYLFDKSTLSITRSLQPGNTTLVRSAAESKAINHIHGSVIVIAGSGMCTGGRIKHHLVHNIENEQATILFVGYQANGTLGRVILEGERTVRILGNMYDVNAHISRISGFSAHADKNELDRWLKTITTTPKQVFITHGEPEASQSFAEHLRKDFNLKVAVPVYKQVFTLD
ncbi:MAG: MBL fold metallo-hydrolase [Lentisphaeria bacterium]